MSALVCLSREGGGSDGAAPLSALASGSLAARPVCSARERERLRGRREGGTYKGKTGRQEGGGWGEMMGCTQGGKRQKGKTKLKEMRGRKQRRKNSVQGEERERCLREDSSQPVNEQERGQKTHKDKR